MSSSPPEAEFDGLTHRRQTWTRPRFRVTALLIALVIVTGCSTVPDRSAESGAVSTTLRALPGVASVDGQYANGMTTGRSYNVTISLESDLDEAALTTIARTYDEQIAAAELAGHTLALTVRSPRGDRLNLFGRDGRMEATPPTVQRWGRLIAAAPGPLTWSGIEGGLLEIPSDDIATTVATLREQAADLEAMHWIIREQKTRVDVMGAYPTPTLAVLLQRLASSGEQWSIVYDPAAPVPLTTGVWQLDGADDAEVAAAARRHLQVLASAGIRVDHAERLPGESAIEVSIGACRTDGSTLQQDLNREFGSC